MVTGSTKHACIHGRFSSIVTAGCGDEIAEVVRQVQLLTQGDGNALGACKAGVSFQVIEPQGSSIHVTSRSWIRRQKAHGIRIVPTSIAVDHQQDLGPSALRTAVMRSTSVNGSGLPNLTLTPLNPRSAMPASASSTIWSMDQFSHPASVL